MTISNSDDVIDSRDVIARLRDLESERADLQPDEDDDEDTATSRARDLAAWEAENLDELRALTVLDGEASGYAADWRHGETLIRDSYFEDYAQQLADDIGAIDSDAKWPQTCIDWKQAARELQMDYTSVDFDGVTYWIR